MVPMNAKTNIDVRLLMNISVLSEKLASNMIGGKSAYGATRLTTPSESSVLRNRTVPHLSLISPYGLLLLGA